MDKIYVVLEGQIDGMGGQRLVDSYHLFLDIDNAISKALEFVNRDHLQGDEIKTDDPDIVWHWQDSSLNDFEDTPFVTIEYKPIY